MESKSISKRLLVCFVLTVIVITGTLYISTNPRQKNKVQFAVGIADEAEEVLPTSAEEALLTSATKEAAISSVVNTASTIISNNSSIMAAEDTKTGGVVGFTRSLDPPTQEWAQQQFQNALNMVDASKIQFAQWSNCGRRSYYFPHINTIFTGVPKTGTCNWIEALLRANGDFKEQLNPARVGIVHGDLSSSYRMGRIRYTYDEATLVKAFKFTVVRNPWTRIVSSYRDKLSSEEYLGGTMRDLGISIVSKMRHITDRNELEKLYPTFDEVVRWVVQSGTGNPHFRTQFSTLCISKSQVKYDLIAPLEYAGSLSQEIWKEIGANTSLLGSYDKSSDPRLQKSALYAREWLSELDKELIEKFYEMFRVDFALMNYSNFTDPDFPLPIF